MSRHLYGGIRRLGDILFSEEYRELFQVRIRRSGPGPAKGRRPE